jgi:hypothetical protein
MSDSIGWPIGLRRATMPRPELLGLFLALAWCAPSSAQERPVAPWPPPPGPLRVVIDGDFANEIDDQYALALALGSPERLRIEGLVAAHFGDRGGSTGIDQSFEELERVLERAGMAGRLVTKRGLGPLQYLDAVPENEGVDFIVETARTATPEEPLWLILRFAEGVTSLGSSLVRGTSSVVYNPPPSRPKEEHLDSHRHNTRRPAIRSFRSLAPDRASGRSDIASSLDWGSR